MVRKKEVPAHIINDSCCNCRFYDRLDDSQQMPAEDVLGECRRFPPVVIGLDDGDNGIQVLPIVEAQHWCGEHGRTVN